MVDLTSIDVVAPNFKKQHSGVTSTIVQLVPIQAREIAITSCGHSLPSDVPNVRWTKLLTMPRQGPSGFRVWHARRNVEMVAGLILKHFLRKKLRLMFTSSAQRRHTAFTKWLIRQQDTVIATSPKSATYLDREAEIIPHGVNCEVFCPTENKLTLRQSLDLPQGLLVGCFGRIRHQKGTDIFVEAMLRTLSPATEVHALIMGRATRQNRKYLASLKSRVAQAGLSDRIHFRDETALQNLAAYFRALDLYIAPQRSEGFGLTPMEALASGVPVIATRVGAFEDVMKDGETGYLVAANDVDAIVSAAQDLLSDSSKRAAFSENARQHAETHFRLQQEADAINLVYFRLLKAN